MMIFLVVLMFFPVQIFLATKITEEQTYGRVSNISMLEGKFVDRFPSIKSAKPKEFCFFVSCRGRWLPLELVSREKRSCWGRWYFVLLQ